MTFRSTFLGAAGVLVLLTGAAAAQNGVAKAAGFVASRPSGPQVQPVAAVEREDEPTCSRSRRRLWLEGEGWVVRRITTCR